MGAILCLFVCAFVCVFVCIFVWCPCDACVNVRKRKEGKCYNSKDHKRYIWHPTKRTFTHAHELSCILHTYSEDNWTAGHRDICGSLGHNLMLFNDEGAYALWFMAGSDGAYFLFHTHPHTRAYTHNTQHTHTFSFVLPLCFISLSVSFLHLITYFAFCR